MDSAKYTVIAPPTFVLNLLSNRKFHLRRIEKKDRELSFFINAKRCKEIETLFEKQNLPYKLNYITGMGVSLKNLIKRYGLLIGVGVCIAVCVLYSLTLTSVKIMGLDAVTQDAIMEKVEKSGIRVPSLIARNNWQELEKDIVNIDGIAFATIHKKGSNLYIEVIEELPKQDIIDTQTPIPLVALSDGVVTKIIATQGTPLVTVGSTVKKGQVLIAPYIKDMEENEIPIRAMGEVYARVWYQNHLMYHDRIVTEVRTERKETKTAIEVLGLKYLPKSSFKTYHTEESKQYVAGILPFYINTVTYYETTIKEIDFNFEEKRQELVITEMEKLKATISNPEDILRSWFLVKKLDNYTQLSIYYELEVKIV